MLLGWLGIVFVCYPGLFLDFSSQVPFGDHGDVRNILSIIQYSLHTPLSQIYHLPFLYPESYVMARTHPLFGISLFYKGFQILGFNLEQSTNLYVILALLLGAWGCYLLIREFVRDRTLAWVFSVLFIVYGRNTTFFHWLNFLSHFYFPFVFYFFLRYVKTRERRHLAALSALAFLQFLASVYYGVQLWVFLLPAMVVSALLLRMIPPKDTGRIALGLGIAFLLILAIFLPFTDVTQPTIEQGIAPRVLTPADLFTNNKLLSAVLPQPEPEASQFFPGYAVLLCVLFFIATLPPGTDKTYLRFGILAAGFFLLTYLAFRNLFLLELVFLLFLCVILVLIVRGWKQLDPGGRLLVIVFCFYLVLLLNFSRLPVLGSLSVFTSLSTVLPFGGLKAMARVYPLGLPLLIVLAALGGKRILASFKGASPRKTAVFASIVLLLMVAENFPLRHPLLGSPIMRELPTRDASTYQKLPLAQSRVVLEIPHYFGLQVNKNTLYTLNWSQHRNPLINGKVSVEPESYAFDLRNLLGTFQRNFPKQRMLIDLIQKYSVTHILVHWDLLRKYQKDPDARAIVRPRFDSLKRYVRVLHDNEESTLFRIQEFFPVQRIIRTYASYHLRNNLLEVSLKDAYSGRIRVTFNGRLIDLRTLDQDTFSLDLRRQSLHTPGNRVEISFEAPIRLEDIRLAPIQGSSSNRGDSR